MESLGCEHIPGVFPRYVLRRKPRPQSSMDMILMTFSENLAARLLEALLKEFFLIAIPNRMARIVRHLLGVFTSQVCFRLPTELKMLRSTPAFKRSLKTFLFRAAYND